MKPGLDIEILVDPQPAPVSGKLLKRWSAAILRQLGWKRASLSILVTGDRRIRDLNRRFLQHDRPTDVIAFPYRRKGVLTGDLVLSAETARRQSKKYGTSLQYELALYLCHGILHLMGYDDKSRRGFSRMEKMQKMILKKALP